MRRQQQVHPRRSARELLLPDRNLVVLDRRRNENHELPLVMGELVLFLVVRDRRAGIMLGERLAEERSQRVALIVRNGDEAPGRQLAMVGSTRGDR